MYDLFGGWYHCGGLWKLHFGDVIHMVYVCTLVYIIRTFFMCNYFIYNIYSIDKITGNVVHGPGSDAASARLKCG